MSSLTMLDRSQAPRPRTAVKALGVASRAAGTPGPGAWAFYLGGPGHNGGRGTSYTNELLDQLEQQGVKLLPIYVGKQHSLSRARGETDADEAMALHKKLGSRNTIIVADVEGHTSAENLAAATDYVNGWTRRLHEHGLRSMVYGSFEFGAALAENGNPKPDAVWIARFRSHRPEPRDPHDIPGIPPQAFASAGQRAWQYAAEFKDHAGDKKATRCDIEGMNVDVSVIDAEVFGRVPALRATTVTAAPAPPHPAAVSSSATHVIQANETLSGLEAKLHLRPGSLFAANRRVLDAAARQHGKPNSKQGSLIFPGVTILIPL